MPEQYQDRRTKGEANSPVNATAVAGDEEIMLSMDDDAPLETSFA